MIKVIRPGIYRNVECTNCGALLRYVKEDVRKGYDREFDRYGDMPTLRIPYNYITCPECAEEIRLEVTR